MSSLKPPGTSPRPLSINTLDPDELEIRDGSKWARTVDDPWDPVILTLDGGGIRGYSSLLILQRLMRKVARWENKLEAEEGPIPDSTRHTFVEAELLPCHYFDFMYGTSTGGLIATMLGRLRMGVPQCLAIYREVGDDLFGHRRNVLPLTTKYDHRPLEAAVKRIVKRHCKIHGGRCDGNDLYPWPFADAGDDFPTPLDGTASPSCSSASATSSSSAKSSSSSSSPTPSSSPNPPNTNNNASQTRSPYPRICHSICLAATHNGKIDEAHLLRSYAHRYGPDVPNWITRYNEGADPLRIWEVARATSAAPFYFRRLEADISVSGSDGGNSTPVVFKDGGIRENNPAGAAWAEFVALHGEDREPALLLSVGTGRPNAARDGFASAWPGPLGHARVVRAWADACAVLRNVLVKYTEGEEKHKAMRQLARGEHRWYKRLNVSAGLEDLKLDSWERGVWVDPDCPGETGPVVVPGGRTLTRLHAATDAYLARDRDPRFDSYAAPKRMLDQAAEKLVRVRRARERTKAQDPRRWELFMGRWLTGELGEEDGVVR